MKILLDTSVLLPGFRRPDLRRKLIWKIIEEGMVPVVTDHILEELRVNILEHYSDEEQHIALDLLLKILQTGKLEVRHWDEYASNLDEARSYVPEKDAPILAAAMLPDMDLFLTYDKKHFLENTKLSGTAWMAKIRNPQEFLSLL